MKMIRIVSNWIYYFQTVRALNSLSLQQLKDIGLSRRDIPKIVRKSLKI